jgi:hypothetical protein
MTIPFRVLESDSPGTAAFLRVIPFSEGGGYDGVLFVMRAGGEPVEFCFSRVETPRTALWRKGDLVRRATIELARALLQVCSDSPSVLFLRADEVAPDVFESGLSVDIPVCRVASSLDLVLASPREHEEAPAAGDLHLFWSPEAPGEGHVARMLVDRLIATSLLTEPFERAEAGLREVKREEPTES